jgi:Flp pilus assembly protein TadG
MATILTRLAGDRRGTSLIETAVIVPVLALLLCGATDMALGFAQKLHVQQAADRAVQFALNAGLTTATATLIQNEASSAAPQGASVSVDRWLECNGAVQPDFNGVCASGSPARFVSVTVDDSYQPVFSRMLSVGAFSLRGFAEGRIQ